MLIIFFRNYPLFNKRLMLLLYRPIHGIMCEWFFLVLHTTDRGCNSPCKNSNGNNYHITKFEVITTYKQSIDIGWHDSQRTPQFINSGKYLILPFKNSLRIGFYLQAIRVVIANMNIEIVYQTKLLFEQIYQFGYPLWERYFARLFFPYSFFQYWQGIVPTVTETFGNAIVNSPFVNGWLCSLYMISRTKGVKKA